MVFVEVFRLLLVVVGVVGGLQVGNHIGRDGYAPLVACTLATLVTYVIGGVAGRLFDRGMRVAVRRLRDMPPAEVFAASVVGSAGLLLGLALGLALVSLVHSTVGYPLAAVLAWVLCAGGARLGIAKGREIVRAAGFGHLLERSGTPESSALVVDTSALLDRHLLSLGNAGLLSGGLVVPSFVLDEARTLIAGPDPVAARRARAGLETLEVLRRMDVPVHVEEAEVPEADDPADKAVLLADRLRLRLATCSATQAARAEERAVPAVNLRRLGADLAPQHHPGERLVVDLVKPGRQPQQAIGYLPDGDMVVVNDAEDLIGTDGVAVVVSAARPTSQGILVFAQLEAGAPASEGARR